MVNPTHPWRRYLKAWSVAMGSEHYGSYSFIWEQFWLDLNILHLNSPFKVIAHRVGGEWCSQRLLVLSFSREETQHLLLSLGCWL